MRKEFTSHVPTMPETWLARQDNPQHLPVLVVKGNESACLANINPGKLYLMARLKPSTANRVNALCLELISIAEDIEPARLHLATIYESLAEAIDSSLYAKEINFFWKVPSNHRVEAYKNYITIYGS